MLKYVSKFAMDILPSVIATIIGAYIVNHYIVTRPGADAPVAAAASPADPRKADVRNDAKPSGPSVDVANLPEPGVKAKGISERAMIEKTAAEKPAAVEKPAEKSADKPAETVSVPVDTRRQQPAPREKTVARSAPAPAAPSTPALTAAPVVAAPNATPAVEAATPAEEHRDVNDLARAAIERLRGAGNASPRTQEAARVPDAPRVATAPPVTSPPVAATPVRPLPPPVIVSAPAAETSDAATGSLQVRPSYPAAGIDRPIPPADIPEASPPSLASRPLDLRAEATEPLVRGHTTVAEDMLSAAKSVFHAVLPK
jgi:hypothetical protein